MRVLLLHPEDIAPPKNSEGWDLIVDLARAPQERYRVWGATAGCDVISLYEFAHEIDDLHLLRGILQCGMGELVDEWAIDWWDVMSLELVSELRGILLTQRLARQIGRTCQVYSTRSHQLVSSLQHFLGVQAVILKSSPLRMFRQVHRRWEKIARLDKSQLLEIVRDKSADLLGIVDKAPRSTQSSKPKILCPTAYVNGSRMAVSIAKLLPDHHFSLVYTRTNGKLLSQPPNVDQIPLPRFSRSEKSSECGDLLSRWQKLRLQLIRQHPEFENAEKTGILAKMSGWLCWGVGLRNAWIRLLDSEEFTACLCTDDSNPPTRIPLILSRNRGLPSIAVHHGALDYAMAVKTHHADFYLTKSEVEHDYIQRICGVPPEKLIRVQLNNSSGDARPSCSPDALAFFTEPYEHFGWRRHEVYRDLLPRLRRLSERLNLRLVFKLHPFESAAWFHKILKKDDRIEVVSGPLTTNFLRSVKLALTVQSSVALECRNSNIPVFLMAWLRDSLTGYARQLSSFHAGCLLESSDDIEKIPELLNSISNRRSFSTTNPRGSAETLSHLFSGTCAVAAVANA